MRNRIVPFVLAVAFLGLTGCAELRDLRQQNENLQQQLRMCESERETLLGDVAELEAQNQTLRQEVTDARQEGRQQADVVARLRDEQARLERQRRELQRLVQGLSGVEVESRQEGNFIVVENDILFGLGRTDLTDQAKSTLDEVVEYLLSRPDVTVRVDGHTDGVPIVTAPFDDNYHLAAMRAHSVMGYLVEQGVNPERVYITGFGPNRPRLEPEEPTAPVDENRRVEILVMPEGVRSIGEILEGFRE